MIAISSKPVWTDTWESTIFHDGGNPDAYCCHKAAFHWVQGIGLVDTSVLASGSSMPKHSDGGLEDSEPQGNLSLDFIKTEWSLDCPREVNGDPIFFSLCKM